MKRSLKKTDGFLGGDYRGIRGRILGFRLMELTKDERSIWYAACEGEYRPLNSSNSQLGRLKDNFMK